MRLNDVVVAPFGRCWNPPKCAPVAVLSSSSRQPTPQMGAFLYRGEKFEQVVSGADEPPLPLHLLHSPEQELAEAAGLFDLPEHRLHRPHSQGVAFSSMFCPQFPAHAVRGREMAWDTASG